MINNGSRCIGVLPNGRLVFVSEALLAQFSFGKLRYELVDRQWLKEKIDPPGYFRIRTHPFRSDYILVKADSYEEALQKYLKQKGTT